MTTPPLKETPEEMEKRIRAKIKADEPMEIPPSLDPSSARVKKADGGMGGMKQYLIPVIISFIISYLVVTFVATSPLNTQLKTVNTTANSALTAANTAIDNAKKAQTSADGASTAVASVSNNMTSMNNQISALQSNISSLQDNISTINTQLKGYVTTSQIAGMATADQVNALNKTILDLQAQLAADEDALTKAQAAITALQTPTTTPTTTPVVGTGVSANVAGNVFTGSIVMTFNPIAVGASASQSLSIQVNNKTGKTLNGLQLALALQSLDSNGVQVAFPTTVTVGVSSNVSQFTWATQSTGLNYLLGWVGTTVNTGFLGQLNQFSQPTGITTYTITTTVINNGSAPTNIMNLMPFIQAVNFTNP